MNSDFLASFAHSSAGRPDNTLFSLAPEGFAWATGIEDTFVAQTERIGERVLDEYALTHHYLYWREDFDRAAALGVNSMRWGIPWYKVEPAPGKFDWDWVDRVLEYAAAKNIAIIADLMHYGTPLWLDNGFINASYPARMAEFAAEFARRYKHIVSHYTPLNEALITMDFCGTRGIWPPYLRGDDGTVKILRAIAKGIVLTIEAIREVDLRAVIVHVDAAGEILPDTPDLAHEAALRTARTFITTDLVCGLVDAGHPLLPWLTQHGFEDSDLSWHAARAVTMDVIGVNYYPEMSVHRLKEHAGGLTVERVIAGAAGMERAVRAFAERYGRPVAITETSTNGTIEERAAWLSESLAAIPRLRQSGVPLVGYTWWPLFDLIDWVYRAGARPLEEFFGRQPSDKLDMDGIGRMVKVMGWQKLENLELQDYLAPMGLYSLEMSFEGTFTRRVTPLVEQYAAAVRAGAAFVGNIGGKVPVGSGV
jgi:beta-glucosidase